MLDFKDDLTPRKKTKLDHFERLFDIALRFGWAFFIYVVTTGNYIR
jgi:hypothetical protein